MMEQLLLLPAVVVILVLVDAKPFLSLRRAY
jgi:hypothetical protein